MQEAWIIDTAHTPRALGKPGKGAYSGMHPQRLLSQVLRAIADRNNLNTAEIDDVIIGCISQVGQRELVSPGWRRWMQATTRMPVA